MGRAYVDHKFRGTIFLVPAKLKNLVERGRPSYGKVIDKDAGDHRRIDYTYNVDGTEYTGSGQGGAGNANFDELSQGTTVWVYFDPANPSISCLGSPEYELESIELLIRAAAIVIPFWPILIFFLIYLGLTKERRSVANP